MPQAASRTRVWAWVVLLPLLTGGSEAAERVAPAEQVERLGRGVNIIVTVHYYHPMPFTHQGAPWTSDYADLSDPLHRPRGPDGRGSGLGLDLLAARFGLHRL